MLSHMPGIRLTLLLLALVVAGAERPGIAKEAGSAAAIRAVFERALTPEQFCEIDPETLFPVKVRVLLLTGQKGATITKNGKIVGGDHVAFYFDYALSEFNTTEVKMPADARRALAKIR